MTEKELFIKSISSRKVAYIVDFAHAFQSINACVFLSQLLYWVDKSKNPEWIFKTHHEFQQETGLTRKQQDGARKVLKHFKILNEKLSGMPAKLNYNINFDRLIKVLKEYYEQNSQLCQTDKLDAPMCQTDNLVVPNGQTGCAKQTNINNTRLQHKITKKTLNFLDTLSPITRKEIADYLYKDIPVKTARAKEGLSLIEVIESGKKSQCG